MADKKYHLIRYQKLKAEGRCARCGRENDRLGQAVTCSKCKEYSLEQGRKDRAFRISLGLCPICGKNRLFGSERNCPECRARQENISFPKREANREKYNEYCNNHMKRVYAERKAQGLCPICGSDKIGNFIVCERCRIKRRKSKANNYKPREAQKLWREQGLCYQCGSECKPGYKVCEKHYQHLVDMSYSEKAVEHRNKVKQEIHNEIQNMQKARANNARM